MIAKVAFSNEKINVGLVITVIHVKMLLKDKNNATKTISLRLFSITYTIILHLICLKLVYKVSI